MENDFLVCFRETFPGATERLKRWSWGAFHSTKTFENLETAANGTEIPEKVSRIPETAEIPKREPFNRKF